MATRKTTRNRANIKIIQGFTVLESLLSLSLLLIITTLLSNILVISQKLITKQQYNITKLQDAQFLYWLFYNQIAIGIDNKNITGLMTRLNKHPNNYDDLALLSQLVNQRLNLEQTRKVEIINLNKLNKLFSGSKYYEKLIARIVPGSDILMISNQKLFNIYFVASSSDNPKIKILYQYSDKRAEELIIGITNFHIKKIIVKKNNYWVFNIDYISKHNRVNTPVSLIALISFVIKEFDSAI